MQAPSVVYVERDRMTRLCTVERLSGVTGSLIATDPDRLWSTIGKSSPELIILGQTVPSEEASDIEETLTTDPLLMSSRHVRLGTSTQPNVIDTRKGWGHITNRLCERLGRSTPHPRHPAGHYRNFGRILILDPGRRASRELEVRLRTRGFTVEREFIGLEGVTAAFKWKPDLIITEFLLPKALGTYVVGRMEDCRRAVPTIFLTDLNLAAFPATRETLMDSGAVAVLEKPVDFVQLMREIGKVLPLPAEIRQEFGLDAEARPVEAAIPAVEHRPNVVPPTHLPLAGKQRRASREQEMSYSAVPRPLGFAKEVGEKRAQQAKPTGE